MVRTLRRVTIKWNAPDNHGFAKRADQCKDHCEVRCVKPHEVAAMRLELGDELDAAVYTADCIGAIDDSYNDCTHFILPGDSIEQDIPFTGFTILSGAVKFHG